MGEKRHTEISGSIEHIHSWHPGDMEFVEYARRNPEFVKAFDAFRPQETNMIPGKVLVYGTGGDMESGDLEKLFYEPVGYVNEYIQSAYSISRYFVPSVNLEEDI